MPSLCEFPRCVEGEKPDYCGNCEGRSVRLETSDRAHKLRESMYRGFAGISPDVVVQLLAALDAVEALETVRLWVRDGVGTEAKAAEAMDAALARFLA